MERPDRAGVRSWWSTAHLDARFAARLDAPLSVGIVTIGIIAVGLAAAVAVAGGSVTGALAVGAMVPAALVDARERRLPDALVGSSAVVLAVATVTSWAVGQPVPFTSMLLGALVLGAPILALHLASPASMGFGDVKAGLVLGAAVGTADWRACLVALFVASGVGGVSGIVRRQPTIAFGVFLVVGSAIALVVDPLVLGRAG